MCTPMKICYFNTKVALKLSSVQSCEVSVKLQFVHYLNLCCPWHKYNKQPESDKPGF